MLAKLFGKELSQSSAGNCAPSTTTQSISLLKYIVAAKCNGSFILYLIFYFKLCFLYNIYYIISGIPNYIISGITFDPTPEQITFSAF